MYTQSQNYLDAFNTTLRTVWDGSTYPVMPSASLLNADANVGPQLLNTAYYPGLLLQLQELKAAGVKAVMVEIGFPMLYEPFMVSQGQSQAKYLAFYQKVAKDIRAAGLKVIVENDIMIQSEAAGAGWNSSQFLANLTWEAYQAGRAQAAVNIVQAMHPDYMVLMQEPDTEVKNSGQLNVGTPEGAASQLGIMLAAVQGAGVPGVQLGAGVGTWLYNFQDFIQEFVQFPLNFIDIHIYPINNNDLPNALTIASMASAAGLPVAITECWLHKILDSELGVLTQDQTRARDPFGFWAPLDQYFLQTMQNLANYTQMVFLNAFSSKYLFSYVPYDSETQNMSPDDILNKETQQATQANLLANFTSTGMSFHNAYVPLDVTAPTRPPSITAVSGNPNMASVSWLPSSDDVGVAGYIVFRSDIGQVGVTAQTYYQDGNLLEAHTYTYTVQAFDLAGNVSDTSLAATVTTKNVTPPTIPANLAASALSSYKVRLTWSPSYDKIGVTSYQIYLGQSPTSLTYVGKTAGTTTSYTGTLLNPSTTYYYAAQAIDGAKNSSDVSPPVEVATQPLPSTPENLRGTSTSATAIKLNWSASTGGLPISFYKVFRGPAPTSLAPLLTVATTSYANFSLTPGTTYYYAVQSMDSAGDLSILSDPIALTTVALPSPPAGLSGVAKSATVIALSWPAAASQLPISNYHVYCGPTPTQLLQVGVVTTLSFTYRSLLPATVYYCAVIAADTAGDLSSYSPMATVTTISLPQAPTGLTANPLSAKSIALNWAAATAQLPIVSYRVLAGSSPDSLALLASAPGLTYTQYNLTPSTVYYYAVQAVDSAGDLSAISASVPATTMPLPDAPASMAASAISNAKVSLSWTAARGVLPITSYKVYRSTTMSGLSQVIASKAWLASVMATKTSYNDVSVAPCTTYYYALQAVDSMADYSAPTAAVQATTPN